MALGQLGVAGDMVLVAFVAVVGAAALAAGIAFGLGAQDVAAEITRAWYEHSRMAPRPAPRAETGPEPRPGERPEPPAHSVEDETSDEKR